MKHYWLIICTTLFLLFQSSTLLPSNNKQNFYQGLPVLVTGGSGFIGSHLVEALLNLGAQVTVLDNCSSGNISNLPSHPQLTLINGSITDLATCLQATKNQQIIFHLASFTSVPASLEASYDCHYTNDVGTLNLLHAARLNKVHRFIFSSSSAVYGNCDNNAQEDDICHPQSPYGYSKYIGEQYCLEYAHLYDINVVILRYFNVFGARQNPHAPYAAVISKFRYCFEHNLPITIYGDGLQSRDFVEVEKVVEVNLYAGQYAVQLNKEIINVASGKSISIRDLYEKLRAQYPHYNQPLLFSPARAGDVLHTRAHIDKLKKLLPYY